MEQSEEKRLKVSASEIKQTRELLKETKVPGPRNPRPRDEGQPAGYQCLVCAEIWEGEYTSDQERSCPSCRSNSIRWIKKR
jgi:hypothetical protein